MKQFTFFGCLLLAILVIGLNLFVFWICQLLWNWLVPLFWTNAPILTYWQAAGCIILLELIGSCFKSSKS